MEKDIEAAAAGALGGAGAAAVPVRSMPAARLDAEFCGADGVAALLGKSLRISEAPKLPVVTADGVSYVLLDTLALLKSGIEDLKKDMENEMVALDLEGVNLSREGPVALLQLCGNLRGTTFPRGRSRPGPSRVRSRQRFARATRVAQGKEGVV